MPDSAPVVYLLWCRADDSLYTGWTTDLERRLRAHGSGQGARYTRSRLPVELAAVIPMPDAQAARVEEARIKRLSRQAKLALVATHRPSRDLDPSSGTNRYR
jgi:putative endonuclease